MCRCNGPSLSGSRGRGDGQETDPRMRQRVQRAGRQIETSYGAVLWAMERYFRRSNADVSALRSAAVRGTAHARIRIPVLGGAP